MSSVVIAGNTSGSVTLQAPAVAGSTVLTLPTTSATLITDSSGILNIGSGQLYKDASGNVGIGTSSPQAKEHIAVNTSAITETLRLDNIFNTGDNGNKITWYNAAQTPEAANISGFRIGATTGFGLSFSTSSNFSTTAAVERMRIDSSGNVGIGTSSPSYRLEVKGASATAGQLSIHDGTGDTTVLGATAGSLLFQARDSSIRTIAEIDVVNTTTNGTGGAMVFQTRISDALAERMRIDSSGNVGIGATSNLASSKLDVRGRIRTGSGTSTGDAEIIWSNYASATSAWNVSVRQDIGGANNDLKFLRFDSAGNYQAIAMQISSTDGTLLIGGATAAAGNLTLGKGGAGGGVVQIFNKPNSGATNVILNYYGATFVGGMNMDNTSTSFLTSSDERLKENIIDAPSAIDSISSIQVRSFDWIGDASHQTYGVIAQEVQSIAPECVCEGQTPEDTWGVDYSKLTPRLVKAIQEQQTLIEALTARLTALEAK